MRAAAMVLWTTLEAALVVGGAAAQEPASRPAPGAIEGKIEWSGRIFTPREVLWPSGTRGVDVKVEQALGSRIVSDESIVVDPKTKGISDCVVRYKATTAFRRPQDLRLAIEGLRFVPRTITGVDGDRLFVKNKDPLPHALEVRDFAGQVVKEATVEPGAEVDLGPVSGGGAVLASARFPFMAAYAFLGNEGPQLITQTDGRFRISGVPAGKRSIEVLHPMLGRKVFTVDVPPGKAVELLVREIDLATARPTAGPFGESVVACLTIDEVPVPRAAFDEIVQSLRARHADFALPDSYLARHAVTDVLMPVCAAYAHHRAASDAVTRTEAVKNLLARGQAFDEVAATYSDDPVRSLADRLRTDLDPMVAAAVFSTPRGKMGGPVWTPRGALFVTVDSIKGEAVSESRSFRHILLRYDRQASFDQLDRLAVDLARRSKVVCTDPSLVDFVPEANRR